MKIGEMSGRVSDQASFKKSNQLYDRFRKNDGTIGDDMFDL